MTRRSSRVGRRRCPLILNAGGRASEDAVRSLVISYKLLGTREWFIIHRTDCGMELFTNETMPELLEKSLETPRLTDSGWVDVGYELGSSAGRGIDWLTFEDARASVVDDVRRIREPLSFRS